MENKEIFKNYMSIFGEMFGKALSPALTSIYWESLKSFTDDQCESAFKDAIVTCKFFPKPADLIELMGANNKEYKSMEAWSNLLLTISDTKEDRLGRRDPDITDPITIATIHSMGGIDCIRDCEKKNAKWVRRDFLDTYNVFAYAPKKNIKLLAEGSDNDTLMLSIESHDQSRRYYKFKEHIEMSRYSYWDKKKEKGEIDHDEYCDKVGEYTDPQMLKDLFKGRIPDKELEEYSRRLENEERISKIRTQAIIDQNYKKIS